MDEILSEIESSNKCGYSLPFVVLANTMRSFADSTAAPCPDNAVHPSLRPAGISPQAGSMRFYSYGAAKNSLQRLLECGTDTVVCNKKTRTILIEMETISPEIDSTQLKSGRRYP